MKLMLNYSSVVAAAAAGLATLAFTHTASAQGSSTAPTCDEVLATLPENVRGNAIYGIGGSASTPTIGYIAAALQDASTADRLIVFYDGSLSACPGYQHWRTLPGTPPDGTPITDARWSRFRYWIETTDSPLLGHNWGTPEAPIYECNAPRNLVTFSHMGNTPQLCPGEVPVPAGAAKFIGPVQTVNFITHKDSQQESISAEAAYYIFGIGPGVVNRTVAPWDNSLALYGRQRGAFVTQLVANIIGVPAAALKYPDANVRNENGQIVDVIGGWTGDVEETLGFVSGSNAQIGEYGLINDPNDPNDDVLPKTRTLAFQAFGQDAAYLPDSDRSTPDRYNVRSGQYAIATPGWLYSRVNGNGEPQDPSTRKFIRWIQGTLAAPEGVDIQAKVVEAGDVPLCAVWALRPDGDVSGIQSWAPDEPCNGWFEEIALGASSYQECTVTSQCDGAEQDDEGKEIGEQCRFGYCEAY